MPKGFSAQERDLIRERLIEQGYKLFSAYGLKKTTVEELADAAGISKGAFYLFYESKEALFMDVAEEKAEKRFRGELLAAIDRPGESPRARLLAVLKVAIDLFRTIPMLQAFTGVDYDLLFRRVPPEKLKQHIAADRAFLDEVIGRSRAAGIPVTIRAEELSGLLYVLVVAIMHEGELGPEGFGKPVDVLLELMAAYCLGEVRLGDASGSAAR